MGVWTRTNLFPHSRRLQKRPERAKGVISRFHFGGGLCGEAQRTGAVWEGRAASEHKKSEYRGNRYAMGVMVFWGNYWYCGEKSVSLRAEQITYHKNYESNYSEKIHCHSPFHRNGCGERMGSYANKPFLYIT